VGFTWPVVANGQPLSRFPPSATDVTGSAWNPMAGSSAGVSSAACSCALVGRGEVVVGRGDGDGVGRGDRVGRGDGVGLGEPGAVVTGTGEPVGEGEPDGPGDPGLGDALGVGRLFPGDGVAVGVTPSSGLGEGVGVVDGGGVNWDGNVLTVGGLAQDASVSVRIPAPASAHVRARS
jgi:hypothetical protein